jgi:hypothetical protein
MVKRTVTLQEDAAMISRGPFALHLLAALLVGFYLPLAAAQGFSITAAPVTTSVSGSGTIRFTVSGVPFDGQLVIGCQYAGEASHQQQARLPVCGAGPVVAFNVTTGQTLSSGTALVPWGSPMPLALHRTSHPVPRMLAAGFLLAGALLIGFRLRLRWPSSLLLVFGMLALASVVSACAGSPGPGPTPGTYSYTLTAGLNSTSPAILTASTGTTVQVTVP